MVWIVTVSLTLWFTAVALAFTYTFANNRILISSDVVQFWIVPQYDVLPDGTFLTVIDQYLASDIISVNG